MNTSGASFTSRASRRSASRGSRPARSASTAASRCRAHADARRPRIGRCSGTSWASTRGWCRGVAAGLHADRGELLREVVDALRLACRGRAATLEVIGRQHLRTCAVMRAGSMTCERGARVQRGGAEDGRDEEWHSTHETTVGGPCGRPIPCRHIGNPKNSSAAQEPFAPPTKFAQRECLCYPFVQETTQSPGTHGSHRTPVRPARLRAGHGRARREHAATGVCRAVAGAEARHLRSAAISRA